MEMRRMRPGALKAENSASEIHRYVHGILDFALRTMSDDIL